MIPAPHNPIKMVTIDNRVSQTPIICADSSKTPPKNSAAPNTIFFITLYPFYLNMAIALKYPPNLSIVICC